MDAWEDGIVLVNATPEAERAALWLASFADRTALSAEVKSRLQVMLDEAVSNVFRHALAGVAAGTREVGLRLRRHGDRVELEVTDDGIAFDFAGTSTLKGRGSGGGLVFLRALADEIRSSRASGHNRLLMAIRVKRLDGVKEGGVDGGP